jgi:hypothetical protein
MLAAFKQGRSDNIVVKPHAFGQACAGVQSDHRLAMI